MNGANLAYAPRGSNAAGAGDQANVARLGVVPPKSAEGGRAAALGLLDHAIVRLEEVVEQETAALRHRTAVDLNDFNNRKSQGLFELNRALRLLDGQVAETTMRERLGGLRAKLDANCAVLKLHLEAVREVSNIVADAIRDTESDGTYSQSIRTDGWRL